jgi:hypothetical protein
MKIEMRPTGQIRPYEGNPRVNDKAVDAVAESIRRFGFRQPIVVDAEGVIVCGHTRWKAAVSGWASTGCPSTSPGTSPPSRCAPTGSRTTRPGAGGVGLAKLCRSS